MSYGPDETPVNPVESKNTIGGSTEYSAAALVLGSLVALILIARGFRGISVGGINVGVK